MAVTAVDVFVPGVFEEEVFSHHTSATVDRLDVKNKLIFIKKDVVSFHPVDDLYKEVRSLRRIDVTLRKVKNPVEQQGNEAAGDGFTPRRIRINNGWRIALQYDANTGLEITGEMISDDGLKGAQLVVLNHLAEGVSALVNYEPPRSEVKVVNGGGSGGLDATQANQLQAVFDVISQMNFTNPSELDVHVKSMDGSINVGSDAPTAAENATAVWANLTGAQVAMDVANMDVDQTPVLNAITAQTTTINNHTDTAVQNASIDDGPILTAIAGVDTKVVDLDADVLVVRNLTDTVNTKVTPMSADIANLKSSYDAMELTVNGIGTKADSLAAQNTAISNSIVTVNSNVNTTKSKVDIALTDIEAVDTKVTAIQSSVNTVDLVVDTIADDLSNHNTNMTSRFNSVDLDLSELSTNLGNLDLDVAAINTNVLALPSQASIVSGVWAATAATDLSTGIASVDTSVSGVASQITSLEANVTVLDTKVVAIGTDVTTNNADINIVATAVSGLVIPTPYEFAQGVWTHSSGVTILADTAQIGGLDASMTNVVDAVNTVDFSSLSTQITAVQATVDAVSPRFDSVDGALSSIHSNLGITLDNVNLANSQLGVIHTNIGLIPTAVDTSNAVWTYRRT